MKLKSFFAETIEAAMAQAGKELGAEAMLLNSRRSEPDLQHLGAYEVVCALAPEIPAPQSTANHCFQRSNVSRNGSLARANGGSCQDDCAIGGIFFRYDRAA